jgi:host factor-I protein
LRRATFLHSENSLIKAAFAESLAGSLALRLEKNMPAKNRQRLQETFLSHLINDRLQVTISLLNGVRLQGNVTAFDDFCISLERDGQLQAVYKQEISTISTSGTINLWDDPDGAPPRRPPLPRKPPAKAVVVERRRRFRSS